MASLIGNWTRAGLRNAKQETTVSKFNPAATTWRGSMASYMGSWSRLRRYSSTLGCGDGSCSQHDPAVSHKGQKAKTFRKGFPTCAGAWNDTAKDSSRGGAWKRVQL